MQPVRQTQQMSRAQNRSAGDISSTPLPSCITTGAAGTHFNALKHDSKRRLHHCCCLQKQPYARRPAGCHHKQSLPVQATFCQGHKLWPYLAYASHHPRCHRTSHKMRPEMWRIHHNIHGMRCTAARTFHCWRSSRQCMEVRHTALPTRFNSHMPKLSPLCSESTDPLPCCSRRCVLSTVCCSRPALAQSMPTAVVCVVSLIQLPVPYFTHCMTEQPHIPMFWTCCLLDYI